MYNRLVDTMDKQIHAAYHSLQSIHEVRIGEGTMGLNYIDNSIFTLDPNTDFFYVELVRMRLFCIFHRVQ